MAKPVKTVGINKARDIVNFKDLWERLSDTFNGLESGVLEYKVASELNNTAGKMINLAKTVLEYHTLRKETPSITFLEQGTKKDEPVDVGKGGKKS